MHLRLIARAVSLAALLSCHSESFPPGRVLLVGIDGATLQIAQPLLDQGRLPNLADIAQQGVSGPLRSHLPLESPRIWASIATGKDPSKHGIRGFVRLDDEGKRRLYRSDDRKSHALWNIASDAGLSVGVVNWWTTYPVEKINGVIVSDHLLPQETDGHCRLFEAICDDEGGIAHPPEWRQRVTRLFGDATPLTRVADPFLDPSLFPKWLRAGRLSQRYRNDQAVARVALEIDRTVAPDLLMVFLPGIDRVSHVLWAGVDPSAAEEAGLALADDERRAMFEALAQYYEFTDALIGKLSEGYGAEDLVMVVSDHGFEAGNSLMVLTGNHSTTQSLFGVVFARGPRLSAPAREYEISVNDITPTILSWLGLAVGTDMDGRPAPFLAVPSAQPTIATHDTTPIEYLDDTSPGAEREILRELSALGYLEGR